VAGTEPRRETVLVTAEFEQFAASLPDGQVDGGDLVRLAALASSSASRRRTYAMTVSTSW
jgi:hypothetical protein